MRYLVGLTFTGRENQDIEWALNPIHILISGLHPDLLEQAKSGDSVRKDENDIMDTIIRRARGATSGRASIEQVRRLNTILTALAEALDREAAPEFRKHWLTTGSPVNQSGPMEASPQVKPGHSTEGAWEAMRTGQYPDRGAALFADPVAAVDALQEARKWQAVRAREAEALVAQCLADMEQTQAITDQLGSRRDHYDMEEE